MCLHPTSLGFLLQHEPQYRTDGLCREHSPVLLVMRAVIETGQDDRAMWAALTMLPSSSHHSLRFNFLAVTLPLHNTLDQCITPLLLWVLGRIWERCSLQGACGLLHWPLQYSITGVTGRHGISLMKGSSRGWRGGAWRNREIWKLSRKEREEKAKP